VASKQSVFEADVDNAYASYSNPVYSNAFSSDGTNYVNVNSQFKDMYWGPSTNSTTILGLTKTTTTAIFAEINAALDPMKAAYANLSTTTEATVQSQMAATTTAVTAYSLSLNAFIANWSNLFSVPLL
jgi:hypothetical protein